MISFSNKRALITGGCGFIGSNLAVKLVELGADVCVADSLEPNLGGNAVNIEPIRSKIRWEQEDLLTSSQIVDFIKKADIIYHLAAQTSHIGSMQSPLRDLSLNAQASLRLLDLVKEHNPNVPFIFTSTRQIYGSPKYLPFDESHPVDPIDINGIHKYAVEQYLKLYSQNYGIPYVILRLSNTYGPRQQLKGNHQGVTGVFLRQALQKNPLCIFGDGQQKRDFCYVDDVVEALLSSAELQRLSKKIYNIGSDQIFSLLDFVKELQQHTELSYSVKPFPEDRKAIDMGHSYSDYSAFSKDTGWTPRVALSDGLRQTIDYFKPRLDSYVAV